MGTRSVRAACDALAELVKNRGGFCGNNTLRRGVCFKHHRAVAVKHFRIGVRLDIKSAVAYHLIGARKLKRRNAHGKGTESHRSNADVVYFAGIYKRGNVKLLSHKVKNGSWGQHGNKLYRNCVDRALNRFVNGNVPFISGIVVNRPVIFEGGSLIGFARLIYRLVTDYRGIGYKVVFKGKGI